MTTTSRSRTALAALTTLVALGGSGCTYTVRLLSRPEGATVTLPDDSRVVTPGEATFRQHVGKRSLVRVESEGYRTLVVDMQRTEGRPLRYLGGAVFQRGGREVLFLLEPEHPPVGTLEPALP